MNGTGRRRQLTVLVGAACGAVAAMVVTLILPPAAAPPPARPAPVSVAALAATRPAAPVPSVPAPVATAPALPLLPGPPAPHQHGDGGGGRHTGLSGPVAEVLALTNAQRIRAGCRPLAIDPRLTRVAQQHSRDMAGDDYFSHTTPSGKSFEQREVDAGYSAARTGGENIARGPSDARTVMRGWMNSPPHRRNILDCAFSTIGIGYDPLGHYWTQDFGY